MSAGQTTRRWWLPVAAVVALAAVALAARPLRSALADDGGAGADDQPPAVATMVAGPELSLVDDGVGTVAADGSIMATWVGDTADPQPLVATWVGSEPVSRVSGVLTLEPGPTPGADALPGGVFVHVYSRAALGADGGRDAQVGMLNSDGGPVVDGATGICVTEACYGTGKDYLHNGNLDQLDAGNGVWFEFSVDGTALTVRAASMTADGTPGDPIEVATFDAPGTIAAVSLDVWGTEWPFVATLSDVTIG